MLPSIISNTKTSRQFLEHDLKMSQTFTFSFDSDSDGDGVGVEQDGHTFLNQSQTDNREDSAMQMNPHSEEPKSHSLPEMV